LRVLITGGHGFVGKWLFRHLKECGDDPMLMGRNIDVTSWEDVRDVIERSVPDVIFHLAALTHVGDSWAMPLKYFEVNALGTLQVIRACECLKKSPKVIVVSSAEVYGKVDPKDLPIFEDHKLAPLSPYAVSKVSSEFLALQGYWAKEMDIIVARPFNHVGPGQSDKFVVSALARRFIEAIKEGKNEISVGNLESRRDYTDVRDVVRAYKMLSEKGKSGEIYNICSGISRSVREIADIYLRHLESDIKLIVDPSLQRPSDNPVLEGSYQKLKNDCSWTPVIDIDTTLKDVLSYWGHQLHLDS
jgi:GDP-4-dehydro-6-deoxy-D-mannose reductase